MPTAVFQMTTYQILLQAQEASHHYQRARYLDAYEAACYAAFLAYYATGAAPDGHDVYHRACLIRSACRRKLLDLLTKGERHDNPPTP